jgi:hypothetical protein
MHLAVNLIQFAGRLALLLVSTLQNSLYFASTIQRKENILVIHPL